MEKLTCHKFVNNNFDVAYNLLGNITMIGAVVIYYLKEFVKSYELYIILILQMRKLRIE